MFGNPPHLSEELSPVSDVSQYLKHCADQISGERGDLGPPNLMILADFFYRAESSIMSQDQQSITVLNSKRLGAVLTDVAGLDKNGLLELSGAINTIKLSSYASKLKDFHSMPMKEVNNLVNMGFYNYRLKNSHAPVTTRLSTDTVVYIL
jgi:hypothetical protein